MPPAAAAHVCRAPAEACPTPTRSRTLNRPGGGADASSPSCPSLSRPKHHSAPSLTSAQVCALPPVTFVAVSPATTAARSSRPCCDAVWPSSPRPQQRTDPSPPTAQECSQPRPSDVTPRSGVPSSPSTATGTSDLSGPGPSPLPLGVATPAAHRPTLDDGAGVRLARRDEHRPPQRGRRRRRQPRARRPVATELPVAVIAPAVDVPAHEARARVPDARRDLRHAGQRTRRAARHHRGRRSGRRAVAELCPGAVGAEAHRGAVRAHHALVLAGRAEVAGVEAGHRRRGAVVVAPALHRARRAPHADLRHRRRDLHGVGHPADRPGVRVRAHRAVAEHPGVDVLRAPTPRAPVGEHRAGVGGPRGDVRHREAPAAGAGRRSPGRSSGTRPRRRRGVRRRVGRRAGVGRHAGVRREGHRHGGGAASAGRCRLRRGSRRRRRSGRSSGRWRTARPEGSRAPWSRASRRWEADARPGRGAREAEPTVGAVAGGAARLAAAPRRPAARRTRR